MKLQNTNKNENNKIQNKLIQTENNNKLLTKWMLPLFRLPVHLKILHDKSKNNINVLENPNRNRLQSNRLISLNSNLEILLKTLNLYQKKLNNEINTKNKLTLILTLDKIDSNKLLNMILNNYYYSINFFIPKLKFRSLLYDLQLFLLKRLLKPNLILKYRFRLRYITKHYMTKQIEYNLRNKKKVSVTFYKFKKEQIKKYKKLNRQLIFKLLIIGNQIINILNSHILLKKKLINQLKINGLLNKSKLTNTNNNLTNTNKNLIKMTDNNKVNQKKSKEINEENRLKIEWKDLLINNHKFMSLFNNNKLNEIKFKQTQFENYKNILFMNENPINISYYNSKLQPLKFNKNIIQNKPIISQYLKEISIFNMKKKGILMSYTYLIGFNFNRQSNKLISNIYNLLAGTFKSMYCFISKPVFIMTPDKIIINLFYYLFLPNLLKFKKWNKYGKLSKANTKNRLKSKIWLKKKRNLKKQYIKFRKLNLDVRLKFRKLSNISLIKVFTNKFKILCHILSHLFKKPIEFNLIRLHYPYSDSNILVNLLAIMINKIKLRIITRKLFKKAVIKNINKQKVTLNKNNIIPAFLSGLKIKVGGRLLTQKVVPRKTVKTNQRGALARGKINYSDVARFTNKNKRGAYSITISSGQNLF